MLAPMTLQGHQKKPFLIKRNSTVRWSAYQEHYRYAIDVLNETGQNYLLTTYEDFVNESFFRRVFAFLGLTQPEVLRTRMRKQNTNHILSRFLNPEDCQILHQENRQIELG